jgi:polar amino acid transport system substrate-binding protein
MEISEVPYPSLQDGYVLVRNHFSLISAGTEGGKVLTARKGYIGKAKEKPEQVKQVLDSIKTEGIIPTYNKVMNKLDAPSPLGYSCAGEVIDIKGIHSDLKIGDYVACGGAGAVHAEVVSVPFNLCVKVPDNVKLEWAAYTTVASIAMQGIRQAELSLVENCVVIGLGLIGQLTIQLLKSGGIQAIGIDIDDFMVNKSMESGADISFNRSYDGLETEIIEFTNGYGTDAVIITAGTNSLDPVELAGRICRKKGKVIIVGAVPTGFSRENYYKKELDLRMSSSYGPGRYDDNYEEKGLDYPIGYVRWTENRNMRAFLDLLSAGKLNIDVITTHVFDFNDAIKAYDMIVNKSKKYIGIILKYDIKSGTKKIVTIENAKSQKVKHDKVRVGFIGAGSFAQKFLLPNVFQNAQLIGVATATGNDTKHIADKYGFKYATGDYHDLLKDTNINTVFIATRHNLHAEQVIESLKAGKNIFVEKPLCMKEEELSEIRSLYNDKNVHLMVGYNRRFSPHVEMIKNIFSDHSPKSIMYRINAGHIPNDSWIQDKDIGGGRIIGEVCHFIDLCMYISNSPIRMLSAIVMDDSHNNMDTLTINLYFENGSIASICYFANGSKALKKEYLEVYSSGITTVIDDFKTMTVYTKNKKKYSLFNQNKGHKNEVNSFIQAVHKGSATPISFDDIYLTTLATFKVIDSIKTREMILF